MEPIRNPYDRLPRGTQVEVRDRFARSFHSGFEVAQWTDAGYQVRRLSDQVELPAVFSPGDVRPVTDS